MVVGAAAAGVDTYVRTAHAKQAAPISPAVVLKWYDLRDEWCGWFAPPLWRPLRSVTGVICGNAVLSAVRDSADAFMVKRTLLSMPPAPAREIVLFGRAGEDGAAAGCGDCRTGDAIDFDFTFAFQPIVDAASRTVLSYEALVRGPNGEPAPSILAKVNDGNRYRFDQACRVKALTLAAQLGMETRLNINFLPNAVYRPEACIRATLAAAKRVNFPTERIVFEVTEGENVLDVKHLLGIFNEYHRLGFATAIDDFGAGYAGLNLLANYQPDYLKLDMDLIRSIDRSRARQAIVRGMIAVCGSLSVAIVAEGVETEEEYAWLFRHGVDLFQGYLFARPGFEALPNAAIPSLTRSAAHSGRRVLRHARRALTA